jgi:hypothetical protein
MRHLAVVLPMFKAMNVRQAITRSSWSVILCAILSIAACGSPNSSPGSMSPSSPSPPTPPSPPASFSVSGHVFEVISGAHVPAADFPVFVRVLSRNCTAPVCTESFSAAQSTRTGADGRYSFGGLPEGRVIVSANTASHAQICGATSVLSATTQLDVEITSRTNRRPSLTMSPLRVSGQLFQVTRAGRVGVSRGEIALQLSMDASVQTTSTAFFLEVDADANGNYLACGLPANWPILFISGNEDYQKWHQFGADGTLDIERRP